MVTVIADQSFFFLLIEPVARKHIARGCHPSGMASLASQPRRRIADSGLSSVIPAVIGIGDGEGIDYTINII